MKNLNENTNDFIQKVADGTATTKYLIDLIL